VTADHVLRVWAEVDLDAVVHNLQVITRLASPARVMAVVKADAYGHGAVALARALESAGAAALGTSTVLEGLTLREAGVRAPIVVLGPVRGEEEEAFDAELAVTVVDEEGLRAAAAVGRRLGRPAPVHLKIDTGMTRLGAPAHEVRVLLDRAAQADLRLEGIFTHLAAAESDPDFTRDQVTRFVPLAEAARTRFPRILRHAANTAGMLTLPEARFEMVRVGLGLYGLLPRPAPGAPLDLRPAMSLWSRVVQVRDVPAGVTVSYGRTHRTAAPTRIATVAIGYGDGYPRLLSNRGEMLVGGRRCPVVGHVTMDYTMIDVGPQDPVAPGDAVMVFGPGLSVHAVAEAASTIAYEILCGIGPRVYRVYRAGGRVVGYRNQRTAGGVAAAQPLLPPVGR